MKMQTFNNKQEYLAAVALWKSEYRDLSINIRANKHKFKSSQREGLENYNLRALLSKLKKEATDMLKARAQGKMEAQRQYLAKI